MTQTSTLTAAQSQIVKELDTAVTDFYDVELFATVEVTKEKHWRLASKFLELQDEFPELAKTAKTFYFADFADEPENLEGYQEALFSLMLSLMSFCQATKLNDFVRIQSDLRDNIFDLSTFSKEYDCERGFWKETVSV